MLDPYRAQRACHDDIECREVVGKLNSIQLTRYLFGGGSVLSHPPPDLASEGLFVCIGDGPALERLAGTLYGNVAADPRPDETPGIWHTYDIHCVGPLITVIVDGQRTLNVDATTMDSIKGKPLAGYIGVQDSHTGAEGWVQYRNIRIKELKPGR